MTRTIDDIIASLRAGLRASGSLLANFSKYTNIYQIFRAVAINLAEQEVKLNQFNDSFYIQTAQSAELDRRAADFSLVRKPGAPSSGHVLVSMFSGNAVALPKATILTHSPTRLQFETVATATITPNRETLVAIRGLTNLSATNLSAGVKLYSTTYPNLEFFVGRYRNPITKQIEGSLVYGRPTETDAELRLRLSNYISSLNKGTLPALRAAILTVPSVSKVFIKEHLPVTGYATAYIDSRDELVLRQVQAIVERDKPAGVAIIVKPLKLVEVDLAVTVTITDPSIYTQIVAQTRAKVFQLFSTSLVGQSLRLDMLLANLLTTPGTRFVQIRFPAEDVIVNRDESLVPGSIEVDVLIDA